MNAMKKLIPTLCLLLMTAMLLGTSTFAWFSMNKTVTATGMSVTATTAGSLIIDEADNLVEVTSITKATTQNKNVEIYASVYDSGMTKDLKYVTNGEDVDTTTGFAKAGKTLTYADVTTDSVASDTTYLYYVDHVFYVASAGDDIENQKLSIKLADPELNAKNICKAFKVLVYANDTYAGVLSCNATANTVEINLAENKVAKAAASGNLKLTFRVYLDGEEKVGGTSIDKDYAIVRNINSVASATATFNIEINAIGLD